MSLILQQIDKIVKNYNDHERNIDGMRLILKTERLAGRFHDIKSRRSK